MPQTIKVTGMSCQHCVMRVREALEALPGLADVQVDLASGTATFENPGAVPDEEIARAVRAAGYGVDG
ncbi:heavy-metal-associated domain-containing protein [Dissulfurirhabdus thermomarina]|uniref:Heavy-metal-associated domain-containing protein n=1 Tax=Dissulfurirhabdus thermomarina TaxID=1765737 RepID=A0A6N9TNZ1_DISTH|nr:heavy-metal-associated domain-containing protein [Dissulfurirhabdus thermomarina]NDY42150.1 heavy-metal-associated domain-containing protein [Dissulfurirhabdus thermomarina]NMX23084.1 heavy-metal-associated domain-containing protein [Dissulfurirhabdus thermomarina]